MLGIATRLGIVLTILVVYYFMVKFTTLDSKPDSAGEWGLVLLAAAFLEGILTLILGGAGILGYWIVTGTTP